MKKRESVTLVWLCLIVAFSLTAASAASAQPGEFVKGVLQPLADGFPNRPIVLVVCDDPGTPDAVYALRWQQVLSKISPVPLLSSSEPGMTSGTYYTLKDVISREGGTDGYYLIILTIFASPLDLLIDPITEETGLDESDLNIVISTETIPFFIYQRKDAPWGPTWAGLVNYIKANPGKVKYISVNVGGSTDMLVESYMRQLGIRDKIVKIPQPGVNACLSTIGAGQGDFSITSMLKLQPHYEAGRVVPILVLSPTVPPPFDKNPNMTSLTQAGLPVMPVGNMPGLAVPKQVPKAHVDWLFKLFKAGWDTPQYKEAALKVPSLQLTLRTGEEANAMKVQYIKMFDPIARELGVHWTQQKKK